MAAQAVVAAAAAVLALATLGQVGAAPSRVSVPASIQDTKSSVVVGRVRVQALSSTLLRIEPRGPMGFEDNTTFMVVDRDFPGAPVSIINQTDSEAFLSTDDLILYVFQNASPPTPPTPPPMCTPLGNVDVAGGDRVDEYPNGMANATQQQCCSKCDNLSDCVAWIWDTDGSMCWLMASAYGPTHPAPNRVTGGTVDSPVLKCGVSASIYSKNNGTLLWHVDDLGEVSNYLQWPSPLHASLYAIRDGPRFYAPPWGPTPIPQGQHVDPALVNTNGYDFRNNQPGDVYVFVLGDDMDGWHASRREFIKLAGPTPLLPDFAYGTWFTYWHSYTQSEAMGEVERWISDKLPIDVWALDMNWRNTSHDQDHFYNHPAVPNLFQNFTQWFEFLEQRNLRTYFNDHPYPVAPQTSPKEVQFRWDGLSSWLEKGLTYWWFDANWKFSIPPPFVNTTHTGGSWQGLDNVCWGAHLYYTTVSVYDATRRPKNFPRPIVLNKFAAANQLPGMVQHQHPAHHRYAVWWTGDGVILEASIQSMVDTGVYDFKPFVHSDCGGDTRGSAGDLIRWISHCAFGTIIRLHGSAHQPWSYDNHTEDTIRNYLNMRYKLIPTFIAAGQTATETAFPLVARCDLFWPEYVEASNNLQYLHLNDTLVAPIYNTFSNETSRTVWIPPGVWTDVWSGEAVAGPKNISVEQPYERMPMWHRQGGLLVTTPDPNVRVDHQDWSTLVLETFPSADSPTNTLRRVAERNSTDSTWIQMECDGKNKVTINVSSSDDPSVTRNWLLRMHLQHGYRVSMAIIDGQPTKVNHINPTPSDEADSFLPFGGPGSAPAPKAGVVGEVQTGSSSAARNFVIFLEEN